MKVIECKGLSKDYGSFHLKSLGFSLEEGELFGFLGPNGSGKTTTVKLLTGQLVPTAGTARVLGVDVVKEPVKVRELAGILPEQENPPSFLSVQEYLEFIVKVRKLEDGKKRIEHWLKFLDYESNKDSLIKDLSRGTKQKVLVTQAFLHEPKLVFIDEPLINLDPVMQKKMKEFLVDYVKKGNSIFLSTHILSIAQEICTSIGIVQRGKMIAQGKVKDVLKGRQSLEDYFVHAVEK